MAIKVEIQRLILDNEFHRSVPVTKKETKIQWTLSPQASKGPAKRFEIPEY